MNITTLSTKYLHPLRMIVYYPGGGVLATLLRPVYEKVFDMQTRRRSSNS